MNLNFRMWLENFDTEYRQNFVINKATGLPMAAGTLIQARDTGRYLANLRGGRLRSAGFISTWGGALDQDEQPEDAIKRELQEESGYSGPISLTPVWVFRNDRYEYHNYLGVVPQEFEPKLNYESRELGWKTKEELEEMRNLFHPLFAQFYSQL